ncbi:hypothetical protein B0T25DRAFT_536631 [Lasiosphaeria hispida]|uniref:Uncharacterized protein n=1 Tax=Lasiosphaeria hispida TaxID=260671 RepID=A0AAJ0MF69_9PEZI|nr:hypothetical protein B0T25DRAFT_536631 [Lasiosphaeria hispida]
MPSLGPFEFLVAGIMWWIRASECGVVLLFPFPVLDTIFKTGAKQTALCRLRKSCITYAMHASALSSNRYSAR